MEPLHWVSLIQRGQWSVSVAKPVHPQTNKFSAKIFVQSGIYQNWRLKLASGILSIRGEIHFAQTFPTHPKINLAATAVTKNDQVPIKTDFFEVTDYKLSFRNS